jgi:hypothetical protein
MLDLLAEAKDRNVTEDQQKSKETLNLPPQIEVVANS